MQYAFHFNVRRCAQCFACEVACKSEHGLRPHVQEKPGVSGPRFRQVIELKNDKGPNPIQYVSMACMRRRACMSVCPARASIATTNSAPSWSIATRCLGCDIAPGHVRFSAPRFDRDGLMTKCDMCIDRLRAGRRPACVESCCGGAITPGNVESTRTT